MQGDVQFRDLRRKLEQHGWRLSRIAGSHHYFERPGGPSISIPVHRGKVKRAYERIVDKAIKALGRGTPEG